MADQLDALKGDYVGKTASDDDDRPDFDGIPVWIDPRPEEVDGPTAEFADPDLNSFLVVERDGGETLQYGRVSGGYEYSERADPSRQQRDESMGFDYRPIRESQLDEDLYRVAEIEPLGEIYFEDGEYKTRRPTKLPQVGQRVYELGATQLETLLDMPEAGTGLEVGNIESGGESVGFRLDSKVMSRHIAVLGRTGVGKTYTGHVFIEELINYDPEAGEVPDDDPGVPVVTFDIEDDVRRMADDVGGTTLDPTDGMDVPFQLIGWSQFSGFLGDVPTDKQLQIIGRAYARIHREALEELQEQGTVEVGIPEFTEYINDAADDLEYPRVDQTESRALAPLGPGSVLGWDTEDWEDLLLNNPIVNVDMGGLGDGQRGVVISAVARMLRILREEDQVPPFVLVIDEAHEFVPSGQSSESTAVVRNLVKTARHIGVGVMLLTQSPSELDSRTLRTCNTYITLALSDKEVKEIEGLLSDLSDRALDQIPNMEQGRAFVGTARDIMTHTVPVKIRQRETEGGSETPDLTVDAAEWREENSNN
jgi:DNA helicase HerA-like ATPase